VTLAEFLIHVLAAHARTLDELAEFLGGEPLLELLELAGSCEAESGYPPEPPGTYHPDPAQFDAPPAALPTPGLDGATCSPYASIAVSVRQLKLAPSLEFYVWAYPFYRGLIESPIELEARLRLPESDSPAELPLLAAALRSAQAWLAALPLPEPLKPEAERASQASWLRFRSEVLKALGVRPIQGV
jgi:hypothetical protein